ncbi:hypothetical protein QLQ12_32525 [Actinoplanes sp. NEAU-A12]|uniref:Uncharacterized protein n=1 Tax=Actinoplanes sandaracinus TaxID=3045177 RepID=A0ABT6WUC0_9ACTN|nr:hypothetical protein [Actinoplanes sandaracinus]MDI6103345.1 hypothetical protein [Actinoplanes sandaracinus]
MAGEEKFERAAEAKEARVVLEDTGRMTVQFRVEDLLRLLEPGGDLAAHCSGCDGCMGCSM